MAEILALFVCVLFVGFFLKLGIFLLHLLLAFLGAGFLVQGL